MRVSFDQPTYTADVTAVGVLRLLEAIRDVQDSSGQQIRFYQASSSEMFGKVVETPQKETPLFIRVRRTVWRSSTRVTQLPSGGPRKATPAGERTFPAELQDKRTQPQLFVSVYNLDNFFRRLALSKSIWCSHN